MEANTARNRFLLLYDKVASNGASGYEDRELSDLFTIAYRVVQQQVLTGSNEYGLTFDKIELTKKQFSPLARPFEINLTNAPDGHYNHSKIVNNLPIDCVAVLSGTVTVASDNPCYDGISITVTPKRLDTIEADLDNPFKRPNHTRVWRIDGAGEEQIISSKGLTPIVYRGWYSKLPDAIVVDRDVPSNQVNFEIGEFAAMTVIRTAVRIATGATNLSHYQVARTEERINK